MDHLSLVTPAATDGSLPLSESRKPKTAFELACERIGKDPAEHVGDWETFKTLNPPVPDEVVATFLSKDSFLSTISKTLDGKFENHKGVSLRSVLKAFEKIGSISKLKPDAILKIVKSERLIEWINKYDGELGALLVGKTAAGKTIGVFAACQLAVTKQTRPPNTFPSKFGKAEISGYTYFSDPGPNWPRLSVSGIIVTNARELGLARDESKLGEDEPALIGQCRTSPMLLIDDLGWERSHQSQVISDVLATRYDKGLPTLSTSGLTLEDLNIRYGDAVMRRMIETSGKRGAIIEV